MPVAVPAGSGLGPVSAAGALVAAAAVIADALVSSARRLARLHAPNTAITNNIFFIMFSLDWFFAGSPLLNSFFSFFFGPNANRLLYIGQEDFAVPDLSGFCCFDNRLDGSFGLLVGDDHFNLKLGQEVHRILAASVDFGMAFLPAEALALSHSHSGNPDAAESILDLL